MVLKDSRSTSRAGRARTSRGDWFNRRTYWWRTSEIESVLPHAILASQSLRNPTWLSHLFCRSWPTYDRHVVSLPSELSSRVDASLSSVPSVPGKLDKFGLSYSQLSPLNPRLIYCSVTGYGSTGPYASAPGYDVVIEAEAGLMHITGEKEGKPVKVGVAVTDVLTGHYAHSGILAALLRRERTGKGGRVECSLFESQVSCGGGGVLASSPELWHALALYRSWVPASFGPEGSSKRALRASGRSLSLATR